MNSDLGFLKALCDLSFTNFVTTKVIKFVYVIAVVLAAIGAIAAIGSGFANSVGNGILMLILSPLIFLLSVMVARIWLEIIIVVFKIAENTEKISDRP